jgi:hypothetical protein
MTVFEKMNNKQEVLKELKEQYDKCDELFNEAYMLNRYNYTRTDFTKKVTTYMADLTQTLGYLIGELEI